MSLREQVSPTQNAALLPAGSFPIHLVKNAALLPAGVFPIHLVKSAALLLAGVLLIQAINAALTLSPCQCPGEDNASLTLAGRTRGHLANAALDIRSLCRRIS